jgi:excisionase family DNA binding protein
MPDVLLIKDEVAKLGRVKPRTVDAWVQNGQLRAIKAGRLNRFLLRDVEKFLGVAPGTLAAETRDR